MQQTATHSSLIDGDPDATRFAPILAENVVYLRKQAKINKKTFALMVGIGRPFLNKIENGTANARLSVIVKMADALGTTPDYLLTAHPTPPATNDRMPSRAIRHARLA
ncbi:helix-turn-helix domain-containing protein [Eggerthella sp. YY7918]|uniref:helix-turn-helix domain-containing protein n=1 Tax=Eggerthella sp. (strain YY7918) TaxID=502558 RepID=UPI0002171329|nr:helix-turn-helix transcriptional regulator [Eggerthella sp. YY7918]BAK45875.1 hypothetical protein EGYY_29100 [Eggerthella sp. YY7918]